MSRYGYWLRKSTAYVSSLSLILAPFGGQVAKAQNVLPQGGSVVAGSATIAQPSTSALSINQTSQRAIINWNSFSVGQPNSVTFFQPNASAAALNRVTGATPSTIAGQLNANGQVFLVNPNGIAITPSGAVNVGGGFVASTLDIANGDFMAGKLNFFGNGASAGVSNQGLIQTAPGGFVGLLGGTVSNTGKILVPLGRVGLGSGEQATLDLYGDGFMQVAVPTGATTANGRSLLEVAGTINAAGGKIELSAATVAQAIRNAVNVSGSLSARSLVGRDGSIMLGGGPGGDVEVTGSLNTSGRTGAGSILITGADVALSNAKLTTRSLQGLGGSIIVTAANSIALGGASLDTSGGAGGGAVRIGGDFHGLGTLGWAATTVVDDATTIKADAIMSGPGGTVVLWSGNLTTFGGLISAQGGAQGGDGGSVEVSSKGVLDYRGVTDLSAVKGITGTLLLDPFNLTIGNANSGTTPNPCAPPTCTSSANGATISATTLGNALNTASVEILTGGVSGQPGNITVSTALTNWTSSNTLRLTASGAIAVNAAITNLSGTLVLSSPGAITQTAAIKVSNLLLLGTGGTYTLNNSSNTIGTLAGNTGSVSFTSGVGTLGIGSVTDGTSSATTNGLTTTGAVTLSANAMSITQPISAAGQIVTLAPATAATNMSLVSTAANQNLLNFTTASGFTNSLANITADTLVLGSTTMTGTITINGAVAIPSSIGNLQLISNATSPGITLSSGSSLSIASGGNITFEAQGVNIQNPGSSAVISTGTGTGTVIIEPVGTAITAMSLATAGASGMTFGPSGFTNGLASISTGTFVLGSMTATGTITVSNALTVPPSITNLQLITNNGTNGAITVSSNLTNTNGNITLETGAVSLATGAAISTGSHSGMVIIEPVGTDATGMSLVTTTNPTGLNFTTSTGTSTNKLANITTGTFVLGSTATTGPTTVTSAVAIPSSIDNLQLITNNGSPGITIASGNSLTNSNGNILLETQGVSIGTTGSISTGSNTKGTITIEPVGTAATAFVLRSTAGANGMTFGVAAGPNSLGSITTGTLVLGSTQATGTITVNTGAVALPNSIGNLQLITNATSPGITVTTALSNTHGNLLLEANGVSIANAANQLSTGSGTGTITIEPVGTASTAINLVTTAANQTALNFTTAGGAFTNKLASITTGTLVLGSTQAIGAISTSTGTVTVPASVTSLSLITAGSVTVASGAALSDTNANGTITLEGSTIALSANVSANTSTGTVILMPTSSISQSAGTGISAANLELIGTGLSFPLNGTNSVGTLAANTGSVSLSNGATALSIGSVGATDGVTTGTLTLTDTGAVTQTKGITATNLALLGSGGNYTLTLSGGGGPNSSNTIATLAANTGSGTGSVNLTDSSALSIGTVGSTNGVTTGTLTLTDTNTVTQTQPITATSMALVGGGGNSFTLNSTNSVGTLAATTGSGTGSVTLNNGATTLSIGQVGTTTGVTTGTLTLTDTGNVTQAQPITATNVLLLGTGGSYTLNSSSNAVTGIGPGAPGTLAANTASGTGAVSFNNGGNALSIGSVGSTNGVTTGTLTLTDAHTVTQTQPITATNLALLGSGGTYTLTSTSNTVGTLAVNTGSGTGSVNFNDGGNTLSIGQVGTTVGVTTGTLTLTDTGIVGQTQPIAATNVALLGSGASYTLNSTNNIGTLAANTSSIAGTDSVSVNNGGNSLSIGTVGSTDGVTTTTFTLNDTGTVTQTKGIVASNLLLLGTGGTFTLNLSGGGGGGGSNATNVIQTLAADTGTGTGAVNLTNTNVSLTIGQVGSTLGVKTGTLILTSIGATQTQPITASNVVLLDFGGSSSYSFINPNNLIGTLSANTGSVSLTNNQSLTIGTVGGTAGVTTSQATSVVVTGDLAIASGLNDFVKSTQTSGNSVVLAATGNFINNQGSNAIQVVAGTARWLVYSSAPAGDTFGNLDSGNTAIWGNTYATLPPASVTQTGNRYIFAQAPTLTFTSLDRSKTYGDTFTFGNVVNTDYSVTGFIGVANAFLADTAATAYSGAPNLTSAGAAATATVAGGPYPITITQGSLTSSSGYGFGFSSTGTLTVNRAALTITANSASKTYGDVVTFTGSEFTTGAGQLKNGETVGSVTLTSAGAAATASVAGSPYAITPSAASGGTFDANNYSIGYVAGALTVNSRPIIVTADPKSKAYDNVPATDPALTYTVGGMGLVNGDVLNGALTRVSGQNVGVYAITQGTVTNGNNPNYTITYVGANFTITQFGLTYSVANVTVPFGTLPVPGAATLVGVQPGDTVTAVVGVFNSSNTLITLSTSTPAGSYSEQVVALAGPQAGNYSIASIGNTNGILTIQNVANTDASVVANALGAKQSSNTVVSNQNCSAGGIADQFKQKGSAVIFSGYGMDCAGP